MKIINHLPFQESFLKTLTPSKLKKLLINISETLYIMNQVYQDKNTAVAWTSHRWAFSNINISDQINLVATLFILIR